jgi:diguanylate cyclase (GGDEF)-like protein
MKASPLSLRGGALGVVICVCAMLILVDSWQVWRAHEASFWQARILTGSAARSIAEQISTTLVVTDVAVARLARQLEAAGPQSQRLYYDQDVFGLLGEVLPGVRELAFINERGHSVVSSVLPNPITSYADREYFRFHATHMDRQPFIGDPIRSKTDGSLNITLSRRVSLPDGSFGGVVVADVGVPYIQQILDRMRTTPGITVALLADDGTIVARSPAVSTVVHTFPGQAELGEQLPNYPISGTISYTSPMDRLRKYGSYHRLGQLPLKVVVAVSEWDMQSSWRAQLRLDAVVFGGVVLVLILLIPRTLKTNRILRLQAMQDGLTGLSNRSYFNQTIEREFRRAARSDQPVSVIMIDIDNFKAYNDHYGHPAGDECLRAVANTIRGCLRREGEFATRYGGEEIAVVLPGCDATRAYALAARMRTAVRGLGLQHAGSRYGIVTFSAGTASCIPSSTLSEWQDLISEADRALYEAKSCGRDAIRKGR